MSASLSPLTPFAAVLPHLQNLIPLNGTQYKIPIIAGPCVIEDEDLTLEMAKSLKEELEPLLPWIDFYFKASFDKANRTSIHSYRGPGLEKGLQIFEKIKALGIKTFTDFHEPSQAFEVAQVVDFLQIPAYLCRQTDMVQMGTMAALKFGKKLNIKKGQFLAPDDIKPLIQKVIETCARYKNQLSAFEMDAIQDTWVYLTERGTSFGHHALVVDLKGFAHIKAHRSPWKVPLIFDLTHSIQQPSANGQNSGADRLGLEALARAAAAAGAEGFFMECHLNPAQAKSDSANCLKLSHVKALIEQLLLFSTLARELPTITPESSTAPLKSLTPLFSKEADRSGTLHV